MDKGKLFDWELYGVLVRLGRVKLGYRKADSFSKHIHARTGYDITHWSLYKIEQGSRIPGAEQFLAINMSIWGEMLPDEVVRKCGTAGAAR